MSKNVHFESHLQQGPGVSGQNKMLVGEVVQIRVNPADCMAVVDILTQVGITISADGSMSFSSAVAKALAITFETLRANGTVPTRDGFEFTEMLAPFSFKRRSRVKLANTNRMQLHNSEQFQPTLTRAPDRQPDVPYSLQRLFNKCDELEGKKNADPLNWSAQEEAQLQEAIQAVVAERCRLAGETYIAP